MAATAYVALGSNLGNRAANLEQGLALLGQAPGVRIERVSALHETTPVGGPVGQGPYLNAAAEVTTERTPEDLLHLLHQIEADLGRVRSERDGPRTLDLDLLFFDDLIMKSPQLEVPHPRLHERLFVLIPLEQIAAGVVHPVLQRTVADLLAERLGVRPIGPVSGRELTGLRALVTGATSGIGRAIACELAAGGADVLVHGSGRRPEAAAAVVQAVRRLGVRSEVLLTDLRDGARHVELVDRAWAAWGAVDVWVNNAGADTLTGEALHWSFERKLQELLAVDVTATLQLSRVVGARLQQSGGVIVNMGWDQAETGMAGASGELFAATKGAVMAFSRSLALSLAPQVRVHCLAPGWIRTAWGAEASDAWQNRVLRETPLRRWGTPADVAATVRFLVSPAARFLTGQVVRVNGGAVR